jgi:hypothetical protein
MDLSIFENMQDRDLKKYIEFILWHYRVMDSFWYIYVSEKYDEATADELNEKVWGRIPAMAAEDLLQRFNISQRGLKGFVQALKLWPWHLLVGYQIKETADEVLLTVPSCVTQVARLKRGLNEYNCKEMHRREFESFARAIDARIEVECLFAPPDPHPADMFCKWRFHIR